MTWKRWQNGHARNYWNFSWESLDVLISGHSAIDMQNLSFYDFSDATHFLESYGYCLHIPEDARAAHAILIEAISFIRNKLMTKEWEQGLTPPQEVLECEDPRRLLLWASAQGDLLKEHRTWSCAILRVMHTIAHLDRMEHSHEHDHARKQIEQRFSEYLMEDAEGTTWFGHENRKIPLKSIEWKRRKSRSSILLKLLHKPGNVSETIYDHLGIRMTTFHLSDAAVLLKLLREFDLITFANTNPSRARNTLLDLEEFRTTVEAGIAQHAREKISDQELLELFSQFHERPKNSKPDANPHSAENYNSIQITCRQRVSYPNPAFSWIEKIKNSCGSLPWLQYIENWYGVQQEKEIHAFYPFEIQIQDQQAAISSERNGPASHTAYKNAQVLTARRRVLKQILPEFS